MNTLGIDLTGGGARGSYQAGALLALSEILKDQGLQGSNNPFKYISGVSAGSINAAYLASEIENLSHACLELTNTWKNISPDQVYKTDLSSLGFNAVKWARDLTVGSIIKNKLAKSLLDTAPLWNLIGKIDFGSIEKNIANRSLLGLACAAYSYKDNRTVTFLQTTQDTHWNKPRRYSKYTNISAEHIMASCAIPILFPSIKISSEYFGDGGFRNTSPISPLLHLGAKKILMIGVRGPEEYTDRLYQKEPDIAKIAGVILNALFFDPIDTDIERLEHINEFINTFQKNIYTDRSEYTAISFKIIRPSYDISLIAEEGSARFPRLIRFLIGGLGSAQEYSELASYLLFVPEFTNKLLELGYNDFYKQKNEFLQWLDK